MTYIFTSAKEVMFSCELVCGFCLFVNKITQKLMDRFSCNFQDMSEEVKGRNY